MPLPRRPLFAAAVAVPLLAAAGIGLGVASASSSEDDRATSGRNLPVSLTEDGGSTTTTGSPDAGGATSPHGGIGGMDRSELQPLLDCMATMGLDIGDADQAKTVIEITWNDPAPPSIAINGTTIEPSAAINAAIACRDELPPEVLDELELPSLDALDELELDLEQLDDLDLDQWPLGDDADLEAWQAKLDAFAACVDAADAAGDIKTWADALDACTASLGD